jgi:ketosteroid isomerase-like protein
MNNDVQYLLHYHAIRDVITRAALALDSRRFDDWLDRCTPDVVLVFPADPANPVLCEGKDALRRQLAVLHQYEATTHFTGNTVAEISHDRANTETYCIAHHLKAEGEQRTNLRMSVRYRDSFVHVDGRWLMSKRDIAIDWTEVSPSPRIQWEVMPD